MKGKSSFEFWCGSEASLAQYLETLKAASDHQFSPDLRSQYVEDEDDKVRNRLLEVNNKVGVISIDGPLVSGDAWYNSYIGVVGYPEIREALVEAAHDPEIEQIMLNIDSPGGSASGIEDISALISKVDREFKPVTAYTKGTMASAAYWIASSAREIASSKLASVGSIGVIATHFDVTKQLEEFGVKATVFRSGEFKALGGPYEELSDTAKEIIQARLDKLYDAFVSQVAMGRNVPESVVRDKMAEGREFLGYEAKEVGLVDQLASIDEWVSTLKTRSKQSNITLSTEAMDMAKAKKLDEKAVAILAAGGNMEDALEASEEEEVTEMETTGELPEANVSVEGETVESTLETTTSSSELTEYLRSELSTARKEATELTMANKELQIKLDAVNATHNQFRSIVEEAINVRSIGLNRGKLSMEGMGDEALVQQYRSITEDFNKTFPVGGVCKAPETKQEPAAVNVAHLKAVRTKKS